MKSNYSSRINQSSLAACRLAFTVSSNLVAVREIFISHSSTLKSRRGLLPSTVLPPHSDGVPATQESSMQKHSPIFLRRLITSQHHEVHSPCLRSLCGIRHCLCSTCFREQECRTLHHPTNGVSSFSEEFLNGRQCTQRRRERRKITVTKQ